MKADKMLSFAFVGMLALFTISCREDNNRNDRDDRYDETTVGDDRYGDGRVGDDEVGDGRVADDRIGDGRVGDDRLGDGRIGDDRLGDGRIGDDRLGDGRIGDGDNNAREVSNTSVSSGRALIVGNTWKVREDVNTSGADERFERDALFNFHSGNTFSLTSDDEAAKSGTWSYNGSTLSLRYNGEATTYSYRVLELTEDRMRLQASDGSELTLLDKDTR
jgi:hypothetical protein